MYPPQSPPPPPPYTYVPAPLPLPRPPRRWWQHPALIITALVVLPPAGIALAWTSQWERTQKILATVLSGVWFLIPLLSDAPKGTGAEGKAQPAAASAAPAPSSSPPPSPTPTPTPSAEPQMPSTVGRPYAQAEKTVEELIDGDLKALSAYADVTLPADHGTWLVCFQDVTAGSRLVAQSAAPVVHLVAPGTACPATPGTDLRPKPAAPEPAPTTAAPTTAPEPDDDGTGGSGGGNVSYKNCTAVKAAGAAPIHRGDPGYGRHLDRDGDGVACER
ncbi:excalibur calcium-binding domain-containing protein [Streptomyces erythrochromogenes]|uniref:excalibur calcium-binding domain-containing protein n=1 Tax=Streptomyces erythrochromogenes TaxID=285574 RepID=UPI0037036529